MNTVRGMHADRHACDPYVRACAGSSRPWAQRANCLTVRPDRPDGGDLHPELGGQAPAGRGDRRRALLAGYERPDQAGSMGTPVRDSSADRVLRLDKHCGALHRGHRRLPYTRMR